MEVTLNADKHSMFGIGKKFFLTFQNPGPEKVDPKELTIQELTQLTIAIRMGLLIADSVDDLNARIEEIQKSRKPSIQPQAQRVSIEDLKAKEVESLKTFLTGNMGVIKKKIKDIDHSKLRKLQKLEAEEKNRPGVLSFIGSLINKYEKTVSESLSANEIAEKTTSVTVNSNVSEIVESEVETVEFNLPSSE